ncbi:MAG: hypothetical protein ACTSRP_04350 [Candidatus Helarchaeota archaeon]
MCRTELDAFKSSETFYKQDVYEFPILPGHKFVKTLKVIEKRNARDDIEKSIIVTLSHILPSGKIDKENFRKYVLNISNL